MVIRSSNRYVSKEPDDEAVLIQRMTTLALQYGRYGYQQITALLRSEGWQVNHKLMERLWRREGLKVPQLQPKRGRLWLTEGSCIRLRPEHPNHVWSYDFVYGRTRDGRGFRMLTIMDEYTRECLAIEVGKSITGEQVAGVLERISLTRDLPDTIFCDNGPEFISKNMDRWAYEREVALNFSRPGKPTDNTIIESFNGSFRDECLNTNWFLTLEDAQRKIETWRTHYNVSRPHMSLGYRKSQEFLGCSQNQKGSPL